MSSGVRKVATKGPDAKDFRLKCQEVSGLVHKMLSTVDQEVGDLNSPGGTNSLKYLAQNHLPRNWLGKPLGRQQPPEAKFVAGGRPHHISIGVVGGYCRRITAMSRANGSGPPITVVGLRRELNLVERHLVGGWWTLVCYGGVLARVAAVAPNFPGKPWPAEAPGVAGVLLD